MKKVILCSLLVSLLIGCVGCSDNNSAPVDAISSDVVSSESVSLSSETEASSTTSEEDNVSEDNNSLTSDDFYEYHGMKLFRPSTFEKEQVYGETIYSGTLSTDDTVYFSPIAYFTQNVGDDKKEEVDYDENDVDEILGSAIYQNIDEFFPCYKSKYNPTVETEEKTDIMGYPFIRRTGYINTECLNNETHKVYYAAYYGVMDFDYYSDVPTAFIAFSEPTDEKTKEDVEYIVDTIAQEAEVYSE